MIEAYCTEIQIDKQWASDTDITILARVLNKCITTHIINNGMLSEPIDHKTALKRCDDPIHVSWTFGNHYSLLMPSNDPDYISLRDFALEKRIPLKLPLDPRLIEFLREYHHKKYRSRSSRPLPGYARNAAIVLNGPNFPAQAASSRSSTEQYANNARVNISMLHLNRLTKNRKEQISILKSDIDKLDTQIKTLQSRIDRQKEHGKNTSKQCELLVKKQSQLIEKQQKIIRREGGTRKHKKLRRTRHRKTRQNKNKSRRRL